MRICRAIVVFALLSGAVAQAQVPEAPPVDPTASADAGASVAPEALVAADGGTSVAEAVADGGSASPEAVTLVADAGLAPAAEAAIPSPVVEPTATLKAEAPEEVIVTPEDEADTGDDASDDGVADNAGEADPESESHDATGPAPLNEHYYTGDLSDSELTKVWLKDRKQLGTISVGFTDSGRLINGEKFPMEGGPWTIVVPENAYGTHETVEFLETAFRTVEEQLPGGPPGRLNHISGKEGGYLRPHHSHQSGRDADVGFYYKTMPGARAWDRSKFMDLPRNWAFLKAVVTQTDVQFVLVDKRIQAVLIKYALSIGEDKEWVGSLFHGGGGGGGKPIVMHARHHRDHFHVRFYNARAQELGRRVQPLLAKDKNEHTNIAHRIRSGDSLGRIAQHYGTTITALRKANGLRSNLIRAGHVLVIPIRGACINCPVPPPVVVPPRRLPPAQEISSLAHPEG